MKDLYLTALIVSLLCSATVGRKGGQEKEQGFWAAQMCVLFITANERPASAAAVECFACSGSRVLAGAHLHSRFGITSDNVASSFFLPPFLCSATATTVYEKSLSGAVEHDPGRFRWNGSKHNTDGKTLRCAQGQSSCGTQTRMQHKPLVG